MVRRTTLSLSCIFASLFSMQVSAADIIKVTVKTSEKAAVAIGFTVEAREFGTLGKTYKGKGPVNKEYRFGYKKDSIFGDNVDCGSLTLTKDSTIILIKQDNKCTSLPG